VNPRAETWCSTGWRSAVSCYQIDADQDRERSGQACTSGKDIQRAAHTIEYPDLARIVMAEPTSVLDQDLLKRAAANLEAEAQLYMSRAQAWSKGGGKPARESGDEKAYERWAELHRAARSLLTIVSRTTR